MSAKSTVNPLRRYGGGGRLVNAGLAFLLFAAILACADPAAARPLKILALGDSLTAGHGLERADSFTVRLESALQADGYDVQVVNAGVSGDTSAGGLSRLAWALADEPDAAIVELGANDGLRGLDPRATYDNIDAIVGQLKEAGVAVLLTGMLAPPNLGAEYGADFESVYPRVAEKHGVMLYPFFLDGVAAKRELNQSDTIHPNAAGVAVIVERILPDVKRLLDGLE